MSANGPFPCPAVRRSLLVAATALLLALPACTPATIGSITRVAGSPAYAVGVSADGRYLLYRNQPTQYLGRLQLLDRTTNEKVLLTPMMEPGIGATLSSDGRYVTIVTHGNLTTGEYDVPTIYRYDRVTRTRTTLDTDPTPADGYFGGVSRNGRYVGVHNNLLNRGLEVIDAVTGTRKKVASVPETSHDRICAIADDGRTVSYTQGTWLRVKDLGTGQILKSWNLAVWWSTSAPCGDLSGDGKVLAFATSATVLPGSTPPQYTPWLYSWSRSTGTTSLLSRQDVSDVSTTQDGRYVFFRADEYGKPATLHRLDRSTGSLARLPTIGFSPSSLIPGSTGNLAVFNDEPDTFDGTVLAYVQLWKA